MIQPEFPALLKELVTALDSIQQKYDASDADISLAVSVLNHRFLHRLTIQQPPPPAPPNHLPQGFSGGHLGPPGSR